VWYWFIDAGGDANINPKIMDILFHSTILNICSGIRELYHFTDDKVVLMPTLKEGLFVCKDRHTPWGCCLKPSSGASSLPASTFQFNDAGCQQ
jgi:hypothetical protein